MSCIYKSGGLPLILALVTHFGLADHGPGTSSCRTMYSVRRCQAHPWQGIRNAFQWANGYLASKGFRQVATPIPGAVVIYQPGVNGTNAMFGHVAIARIRLGA